LAKSLAEYAGPAKAAEALKQKIDQFKEQLPLIAVCWVDKRSLLRNLTLFLR
jgi:hypothetical protein